jgi:two-component system response regulator FixJ
MHYNKLEHPALSKRELEIAWLIIAGNQSKAIGDQLHISYRTVQAHIENARRKLKARNIAELVRILLTGE